MRTTFLILFLVLISFAANATEERYDYDPLGRLIRVVDDQNRTTEFQYDAVGNLLNVVTNGSSAAPVVSVVSVTSMRRDDAKDVSITGTGLSSARVVAPSLGFSISDVRSTATQLNFRLFTSVSAALGANSFQLVNAAGGASFVIAVHPLLPTVYATPAPLAFPADAKPRQFTMRLSTADAIDHTVNLSIDDASVAIFSPGVLTFPAGTQNAVVNITPLKEGVAKISATSATLAAVTVPIYVATAFTGSNVSHAAPLGVSIPTPPPPGGSSTISPILASNVGITVGAYIKTILPRTLIVDTGPVDVMIFGDGLNDTASVIFEPAVGLTVGSLTVAADGKSVVVPVTVADNAPATWRHVIVKSSSNAPYPTSSADADRILVTAPIPEIESIQPLFAVAGSANVPFVVRGANFRKVVSINFTPSDGINVISTPVINVDGTTLTANVKFAADAAVGTRIVTVTAAAGSSSGTPTPSNTFAIVNAIQTDITPIVANALGVQLDAVAPPAPTRLLELNAGLVGVAVGGVVRTLTPGHGSVGENVALTIEGGNLQSVTALNVIPPEGVTVSLVTSAGDGKSVTATLSIAASAAKTFRRVQVLTGVAEVPFASARQALFEITVPAPVVDVVAPLNFTIGSQAQALTVVGRNLERALEVKLLPPEGVRVSLAPVVSSDGKSVSVSLDIDPTAVPGPRTVVVVTPVADTSHTGDATNTINLASGKVSSLSPIVSALVGVQLESPPQPALIDIGPVQTPSLGVQLDAVTSPLPEIATGPVMTASVGVQLAATPPAPSEQKLASAVLPLGVSLGPIISRIEPTGAAAGTNATLTMYGYRLDGVTGVSFEPAGAVSVTGAITIASDGSTLSVPITVAPTATRGTYIVNVTANFGPMEFADANVPRFYAAPTAQITSVSPVALVRGSVQKTLTITGTNLFDASTVTVTPSTGVTLGAQPVVNNTGTQLTVQISVAADAPTTARVVQVISPAGASAAVASPANTLTISKP